MSSKYSTFLALSQPLSSKIVQTQALPFSKRLNICGLFTLLSSPLVMLKIVFLLSGLLFSAGATHAQQNVVWKPCYGQATLELDSKYYYLPGGDSLRIEVLRFYISGIELLQNETTVYNDPGGIYLIDAADNASCSITLQKTSGLKYNRIRFHLGLDSFTNVSGALGGALDPTRGMYWTWQSGYINFKLEGSSNLCPTRKNEFQFHLGGYLPPNNALQTIVLKTSEQQPLIIGLDIEQFLRVVDLSKQNHIMSPGKEAVLLSATAASAFSIQKP